jgi:hypothetical protein
MLYDQTVSDFKKHESCLAQEHDNQINIRIKVSGGLQKQRPSNQGRLSTSKV